MVPLGIPRLMLVKFSVRPENRLSASDLSEEKDRAVNLKEYLLSPSGVN